jgi:hypothetical protein
VEKASREVESIKSGVDNVRKEDLLFSEKTAVLHISG